MNTSDDSYSRQRRRKHSAEFKAKVIAACRRPGVSISAVALANKLNANLLRRWVVAEEQNAPSRSSAKVVAQPPTTIESPPFVPVQIERSVAVGQEIRIEVRRGATVIKIGWPATAAAECAAWLRELLR